MSDNGCPCCGDCCEEARLEEKTFTPEHDCMSDTEFCEYCYAVQCHYCGGVCYCNV